MKKVLIYPICFISTCAIAKTTFYYETGGQCPVNTGLFLNPNATSCSEAVTKVTTPTVSGWSFAGYWAGNTQVIDSNGNILVNSSTAPNLFDISAENHNAQAAFTGTDIIAVRTSDRWDANNMYSGWYTCQTNWGLHACTKNGNYVAPPAELWCHTSGGDSCISNDGNCDYKFNSWVLGANHTKFVSPSCYGGLSQNCPLSNGCWCNHYQSGQIAYGNGVGTGLCTESDLNPISESTTGILSIGHVYPFACKRFYVNGTWTDEVDVANGRIILDNSTPGTCRYEIVCNEGYHQSYGNSGFECTGTQCKNFFNGNPSPLNITASCEQDTQPECPTMQNPDNGFINHPTPNNGQCDYTVTCNNTPDDYGYACDETTGLCSRSCTVGSDCNNLKSQYTGAQNSLCKRCLTVEELDLQSTLNSRHINVSLYDYDYDYGLCAYDFRCKSGYVSNLGGGKTVGCALELGDCSRSRLLDSVSDLQCTLACPTAPDVPGGHGSVPPTTPDSDGNCHYTLNCNNDYAMPDGEINFTCAFNTCEPALTNWVNGLQCRKKINCANETSIDHGTITGTAANNETACRYTVQCHAPAYVCNGSEDECASGGYVCDTNENCNAFLSGIECEFQCPSVAYVKSKIKGLQNIGFRTDLGPEKQCYYSFPSCGGCYQLASDSANSIYCNDTDDEQCNNNTWYNGIHCEYVGGDGCLSM